MKLTLYGFNKTRSMRPQWLLEELALDYHFIEVNIFQDEGMTKEYRKIQPYGQVPALDVDGKIIFESGAICHWLADQFPEQGLAPALNDPLRADYEQWMFYSTATLEPPAFNYILHTQILPEDKRVKAIADWNEKQTVYILKVLNNLIKDKPYLLGEQFSTADIMMAYLLFWFPDILKRFSVLQDYCERLSQRKAYLKIKALNQ
ncbi:MAG: glutathione S-transferase family protein [gamma proteobacterium symbiont of Bathyaustriella thionipta]|nr:glutathione S-transferase family protein [gamma proteobacterium symbiont of Bathyaustriella thionipta]MCU7951124.1 glutathione S-transferase family protein [gamma proteobacterium symbiont of Bathyaustriella thionipta]MCU7954551.1 glutathione S-transferase family protein [gamma proteobacterium symbiont of Bathyaustriella thionipta]MCU7957639.1 glutathione S-transferase family protein [gamma proteobacterium symbiont of Bathyaustriella thionipta]MCU7966908.1 glutathione S-transferase family pro